MKAEKGKKVTVHYKLYIDDPSGDLVEETMPDEPYEFIVGSGEQFEVFDKHIIGLEKGDSFSFAIEVNDAFGEIDENSIADIPKKVFEHEGKIDESLFELYNVLPMNDEEGNEYSGVVIGNTEEHVTLDFNHPLAGENIWFDGEIIDIE